MKIPFDKILLNQPHDLYPECFGNFTHYELVAGGIILTSNKNFKHLKTVKLFIPERNIVFIYTK